MVLMTLGNETCIGLETRLLEGKKGSAALGRVSFARPEFGFVHVLVFANVTELTEACYSWCELQHLGDFWGELCTIVFTGERW